MFPQSFLRRQRAAVFRRYADCWHHTAGSARGGNSQQNRLPARRVLLLFRLHGALHGGLYRRVLAGCRLPDRSGVRKRRVLLPERIEPSRTGTRSAADVASDVRPLARRDRRARAQRRHTGQGAHARRVPAERAARASRADGGRCDDLVLHLRRGCGSTTSHQLLSAHPVEQEARAQEEGRP